MRTVRAVVRRTLAVLAVVLTASLVVGLGVRAIAVSYAGAAIPPLPRTAAALVNGVAISEDDVAVRLEQVLPLASYHGSVEPAKLLSLRRAALDELVLDELIAREAMANRRAAAKTAVDAELAEVKARFDGDAEFAAALAENGLTESAFRARLARAIVVREARSAHERQAVTEADVAAYYQANGRMFERPESVHLLEILVRRDPAEARSARAAEGKARSILARLQRGERFDRLARACSDDEYRVKDGDMGFVHRGRLDATFEQAVFAAEVGRFAVAESLYGFEVFKVVERKPAEQLSLEEARPIIAERLARLRREQAVRAWHAKLLAEARIDIRDEALRAAKPADISRLSADSISRRRLPAGGGGHP